MNFQDLLKNKTVLIGIIAGTVVILVLIVLVVAISAGGGGGKQIRKVQECTPDGVCRTYKEEINVSSDLSKPIAEDIELLTTDNLGKALEIQALLAKEGIRVSRGTSGSKSALIMAKKDGHSMDDRDRALIAIVKSGYMDQNVGLEIFDKGDFTSTKEDKRIRLSRAINGELARLIRKIEPIESASVFVSIPEQAMFTADKKPITATVQLVIKSGERLPEIKVRAIQNLLLGSINGLSLQNISITDTNGNVYNSVIGAEDDILAKMQENDQYMTQKVQAQLNKLIGKGNYVVTVSTHLREVPLEKTSLIYDPEQKATVSEQVFTEGLGDQSADTVKGLNAVTTYLPSGLPAGGSNSAQTRKYARSAKETQYGVSKTQVSEYLKPGVVEEISIAVTLEQNAVPTNVSVEELKELIASAASPKAFAENVTIAFSDTIDPFLATDKPTALPKPEPSGNPWWLVGAIVLIGIIVLLYLISQKYKADAERQTKELEEIKARSAEQEKQLQDVNLKAAELIERQTQLAQNMLEVRTTAQQAQAQIESHQQQQTQVQQKYENPAIPELMQTVSGLSDEVDDVDEDDFVDEMQSWIERS